MFFGPKMFVILNLLYGLFSLSIKTVGSEVSGPPLFLQVPLSL